MAFASSLLALGAVALSGAAGCGATCDISDEGNPPEIFTGGAVLGDSYASSPMGGPLLHFPGGKQYQLVHHLGFTPSPPSIYFAFAQFDDRSSPCAGNSCEVRCVDDQIIWIKNDTCTEFWVVVNTTSRSPYPVPRCTDDNIDAGSAPTSDAPAQTGPDAAGDAGDAATD
jgi:hypothetical protein